MAGILADGLALPMTEPFNDRSQMVLPIGFTAAGNGNYFGLTGGATSDFGGDTPAGLLSYTGCNGSYLATQDLDDSGTGSVEVSVWWPNIDTAGAACAMFSGQFAEALASNNANDIDATDYISVDYTVDGKTLLLFVGAATNDRFYPVPNFDGVANTTDPGLGPDARTYTASTAPLAGATRVTLRLTTKSNGADEDAAFDNFALTATTCPTRVTTTTAPLPALSLPFFEGFADRSQMLLSHDFDGNGNDYFGIENGDNSDFGTGTASTLDYDGKRRLSS